ncbi:hypothetical protein FDECE_10144 [Fusarium decemcellulare]|nr:hypothetical protein FDECE_10144 [Fusarium decemcellulare]
MPISTLIPQHFHKNYPLRLRVLAGLRCVQFILAIVIAGLYGSLLAAQTSSTATLFQISIFAEVVAVLSAITCALSCFVTLQGIAWCICDGYTFVLWTTLFGTSYPTMRYIGRVRSEGRASQYLNDLDFPKLQVVVHIDFFVTFLWLGTTIQSITSFCLAKKRARNIEEAKTRTDFEAREVFDD